jgi:hypothetical protein
VALFGIPTEGSPLSSVGQVDPAIGGYYEYFLDGRGLSDNLLFVWNEQDKWNNSIGLNPGFGIAGYTAGLDQSVEKTATFWDQPQQPCLPPDYEGFLTYLVGVSTPIGTTPPQFTVLSGFMWNDVEYNLQLKQRSNQHL